MRRLNRKLFWLGFDNTAVGLRRKLPLFAAAAVAMLTLTLLDGVKTNYEIRTGNAGRSFVINDEFLKILNPDATERYEAALKTEASRKPETTQEEVADIKEPETPVSMDDTLWGWLNEPYRFKYQKFANRRALLDALAAKARLVRDQHKTAMEKERGEIEEKKQESAEQKQKLEKELEKLKRKSRRRTGIETKINDLDTTIKEKTKQINVLNIKIGQLEPNLRETTKYVYNTFDQKLPDVLLKFQKRKTGLFDDLLTPILNEQSSLNVVYQVFRLTALIIVILSFVFILVMLIQQSPFSGDTDTVSTQLRTLISTRSAGLGADIAKTAIVSVTALGVGTAVFVGAIAPDTPATSGTAGSTYPSTSETIPQRFRDVLLPNPNAQTTLDPVAEEYLLQALFSEQNRNYFYDLRQFGNSSQLPPPVFKPNILPAPVQVRVVPGGNSQALLDQLDKLINKVNSASDLTQIRQQITNLEAALLRLNQPECQCAVALDAIAKKIGTLNATIGASDIQSTPMLVLPPLSPSPSPSPSTASPSDATSPMPTPTPSRTSPTILNTLTQTAAALDAIDKELKAIRADNLIRLGASSRNLATRAGEFLGSEYYLVSEQTYLALQDLLKGNANYDALMEALKEMQKQPPLKKDPFLKQLRKGMAKPELEQLKPWEKVILNYARLRR